MCRSAQRPTSNLTPDQFKSQFSNLLSKAADAGVAEVAFFWVPADLPPWFDTGLALNPRDEVTVVTAGRAVLSRDLGLEFHPDMQLWYRLGTRGEVFRGTRNTHTIRAESAGHLFLGNYFPGEWATRTGSTAVGTDAFKQMQGGVSVLVLRWKGSALQGLKQVLAHGDVEALIAGEIDRLERPASKPAGWDYLWYLGTSEIFSAAKDATHMRDVIRCSTHRDAAILHKNVSVPLLPGTTLTWSWKVDALPCHLAENTLENHDYLSVAVEFDNGQDLTFLWSSQLPVDTGFRCPIPTWTARETHVVARTGNAGLGEWCTESRDLFDYYQRFIGTIGPPDDQLDPLVVRPPTRVVRFWLIANSMFRQNTGQCEYGAIELTAAGNTVVVN